MTSRRFLLKTAAAGLAGLALPFRVQPVLADGDVDVTRLRDDLFVLTGAGDNVLLHVSDDGQLLVDSGAPGAGDALLAALAELPGTGRVHTLFNTHWHLAQTGANAVLGERGATIIAHEKSRQRLANGYYLADEDRYEPPLPEAGRPSQSFLDDGELTAGRERIEYGYLLLAHTDGDIYVHFRDANVIAVGDALSPLRDPELDWFGGGWLGGRVDALQHLLDISNDQTRFVPSYGPVVQRDYVQAEHDLMLEIFELMVERIRLGESAEDIIAAGALDGLARSFDDVFKFIYDVHKGLWAHHNKLMHDIV
jgi:cyclase